MRRFPLAALAAAIAIAFLPNESNSQTLTNGTMRQCIEAAPTSELRRTVAYIRSNAIDSAPSLSSPADLLIEILGERVRNSLGAKPGELPVGEPAFTDRNTSGSILVSMFRDGRLSLRVRADSGESDTSRIAGTRRVADLMQKAWDEGERVFWPDKAKGDSGEFAIEFWKPNPRKDAPLAKPTGRFAVAVFSLALPWAEPAFADVFPLPDYPSTAKEKGIEGVITLSFIVDTTGHAMMSTVRDVLPYGAPVPVGDMADRYREFVSASKAVLPKAHFRPASVAGCKVQQLVQLPFTFSLSGKPR